MCVDPAGKSCSDVGGVVVRNDPPGRYYECGIAAGVETMTQNPMAWSGGMNPRVASSNQAQACLVPMVRRCDLKHSTPL
jgi:hypothetical protein